MYVIKEMRINRFVDRPVASASTLFRLYGYSKPAFDSNRTAENMDISVPLAARKTQILALAADSAAKAQEFKSDPEGTKPLPRRDPKDL